MADKGLFSLLNTLQFFHRAYLCYAVHVLWGFVVGLFLVSCCQPLEMFSLSLKMFSLSFFLYYIYIADSNKCVRELLCPCCVVSHDIISHRRFLWNYIIVLNNKISCFCHIEQTEQNITREDRNISQMPKEGRGSQ